MRIVLFNWRDMKHPRAGGAELYTHQGLTALARRGHECVWFASASPGLPAAEATPDYKTIRAGTELSCRLHAYRWLAERHADFDVIIDEVNTLPWLSPLVAKRKTMLLIHQLAREVWWAEAPPVIATFGYFVEPAYLQLYRSNEVITVSNSSANSLRQIGLRGKMHVVENGLQPPFDIPGHPIEGLVAYVGRITPSKRVSHIIRAVALARRVNPRVRLLIVGGGSQAELHKLRKLCAQLQIGDAVEFAGRLSNEDRDSRLQQVDVLALASLREGWGLVVSEAARWRIPAVAYPVAGVCDSIINEQTGLLAATESPDALAESMIKIVGDRFKRDAYGQAAAARLAEFSSVRFAERFCDAVERHV